MPSDLEGKPGWACLLTQVVSNHGLKAASQLFCATVRRGTYGDHWRRRWLEPRMLLYAVEELFDALQGPQLAFRILSFKVA